MTRWIVLFEDTPAMLAHRKTHGKDHIAYLKDIDTKILVGGGLRPIPDAPFVGGLWVVGTDTHEEVVLLMTDDPYFNPVHRSFRIFSLSKAIDKPVTL